MSKLGELKEILKKLIAIPSVTGNEHDIAIYIADYLRQCGVDSVELQPVEGNRLNVVAHLKGEKVGPVVLLTGHMDTVAPGEGWRTDPFKATERDGRIYGRGAADTVERYLPGISQMQVNEQAGITFEAGLRAVLRQDPDIIMVGETRDPETAKISVRAAITGHLVLSTLHTKSAAGGITRMADMGVEPYLTADSLCGMAAQRLVRKVCPHCAETVELTNEEQKLFGRKIRSARRGRGCEFCRNTGYKGRTAVHEIFVMDRELKKMTAENRPEWEIEDYVVKTQGMRTMREELADLVCAGVISMEEFLRTVETW